MSVNKSIDKAAAGAHDAVSFVQGQADVVKKSWKPFAVLGGLVLAVVLLIAVVL